MENVFDDLNAQISTAPFESDKVQGLQRNAFVFITTEDDSSKIAFEDLIKVAGVKEVYFSHGTYDLIAKVSGESFDHLREIIFRQIKNLGSIKSTLTLMVV